MKSFGRSQAVTMLVFLQLSVAATRTFADTDEQGDLLGLIATTAVEGVIVGTPLFLYLRSTIKKTNERNASCEANFAKLDTRWESPQSGFSQRMEEFRANTRFAPASSWQPLSPNNALLKSAKPGELKIISTIDGEFVLYSFYRNPDGSGITGTSRSWDAESGRWEPPLAIEDVDQEMSEIFDDIHSDRANWVRAQGSSNENVRDRATQDSQRNQRTSSTSDRTRESSAPDSGALTRADACSILGVPLNATPEDIKKRFRYLTRTQKMHPDLGGDQREFITLKAAYEFLMQ